MRNDQQSIGKTHGKGQWRIVKRFWDKGKALAYAEQVKGRVEGDAMGEWMVLVKR